MYHNLFCKIKNKIAFLLKQKVVNGKNNNISISCKKKNTIVIVMGNNNSISIPKSCILNNTKINISGDNNHIIVEDKVRFMGPCEIIMQGNSTLTIGYNAGIRGVQLLLNQADISIGKLCMFSNGIIIRNHDSHKVLDSEFKQITNPPKKIIIGDHVWIGQNSTILKGVTIGNDSIIGMGSVVTKSCKNGSILAGNPARIVKENITWDY